MTPHIRPELANHPIAKASREINDYCEANGLDDTCSNYGIESDDLRYFAEQRALRSLFAGYGRNVHPRKPMPVQLSDSELSVLRLLTASYMDGLLIGRRAKEMEAENE